MGTFHDNMGELHGITVVVATHGETVYIGRFHEERDEHLVLFDVGEHTAGADGQSNADYVAKAAKFGVWPVHKRLLVPRSVVASITPLGHLRG